MSEQLDELMVPLSAVTRSKGVRLQCEICGKPATIQCVRCPTYYCSKDHFALDWTGVLNLIFDDIDALRKPPSNVGSEEERIANKYRLDQLKAETIERALDSSHKHLVAGEQDKAIPGALYALKFSIELYGPESDKLVSPYLFLAEANLGLRRPQVAEEFLALANWSLLKHSHPDHGLIATLHKNFGRLYALQKEWDKSLDSFATSIYHSARQYGPLSPKSGPVYYAMGRVFQSRQMTEQAKAFFGLILEIYASYLQHMAAQKAKAMHAQGLNLDGAPLAGPEAADVDSAVKNAQSKFDISKVEASADPGLAFGAVAASDNDQDSGSNGGLKGLRTDMRLTEMELEESLEVLRTIHNFRVKRHGADSEEAKDSRLIYEGVKAILDEYQERLDDADE